MSEVYAGLKDALVILNNHYKYYYRAVPIMFIFFLSLLENIGSVTQ